ncbi:MAG: hypothetical protein ABWZ67_06240, partial [Solirubrobacteraceae bacterium]
MPNLGTIVIDMLNPYDHEDGEELAAQVPDRIEPLKALIGATPDAWRPSRLCQRQLRGLHRHLQGHRRGRHERPPPGAR